MSGKDLKELARDVILKKSKSIFFAVAVMFTISTVMSRLMYRLPGVIDYQALYDRLFLGYTFSPTLIYREFRPAGVVLAAVLYLFVPVLNAGYMNNCMKNGRGTATDYKDVFSGFMYLYKILAIFFLKLLFIVLWSLLLIVPGLVAAYRYRLAYYIMLDDPEKTALQCIRESKAMMRGHKTDLLIIDLSFLGWYILDFSIVILTPLPYMPRILLIWILPYRGLVNAGFYDDCKTTLAV